MALISAPPVLDRPLRSAPETATTDAAAALAGPAPAAVPAVAATDAVVADAVLTEAASTEAAAPDAAGIESAVAGSPRSDAPVTERRVRRLPRPPGRRGPMWLAALVAGAIVAGISSFLGSGPQTITADPSDYGLGVASDLGISGGMADTAVRQGLTQAEAQARLGELAASRAAREPETVVPVTEFRLTTCYCMRWGQMHYGLDFAAPLGTPIYSAVDGVVIRAGSATGFGNAVYIQDAGGDVHIYGHMRYYDVEAGDLVHAGDKIAEVGNEGYSTGPHLHYEIHRGGEGGHPIDPQEYLAERGVHI